MDGATRESKVRSAWRKVVRALITAIERASQQLRSRTVDPMDALIVSALDGSASEEELERLRQWRAASLDNERRYRELWRLWTAMTATSATEEPSPPPDPAALMQRAGVRTLPVAHRSTVRFRTRRRWVLAIGAAAAVLGTLAGLRRLLAPAPRTGTFGADEFVTGATEMSTVQLRDGTVVRLAPRTRLRLIGRGGDREVSLEGRAYFAVARVPGQPFWIRTSAGDVTVLGTRFDLEVQRKDLRLIVIDGQVKLSAPGSERAVRRGEMTRVLDGTALPIVQLPDLRPVVDWVGNFLAFQSTPLREAVREIAQRYGVRIEIQDSALAERTVTAWFADRSVEEVMRIVCAASLAECGDRRGVMTMRAAAPD